MNCRTEEITYSSEYVAEISLSANDVYPRILSFQERKTICSSLCYKSEQLQTCLPFLVHTTTRGCTYIITFLLVSCISKQKLDLGGKNTSIKTCELVITFDTFTIATEIQNTRLPVWYDAKVSIQTLVASGVVCACPIATISWLMMTSCSVLVS